MGWNELTSNQPVSWDNMMDAVDKEILSKKPTNPGIVGTKCLSKAQAFANFAIKSISGDATKLPKKSEIIPVLSYPMNVVSGSSNSNSCTAYATGTPFTIYCNTPEVLTPNPDFPNVYGSSFYSDIGLVNELPIGYYSDGVKSYWLDGGPFGNGGGVRTITDCVIPATNPIAPGPFNFFPKGMFFNPVNNKLLVGEWTSLGSEWQWMNINYPPRYMVVNVIDGTYEIKSFGSVVDRTGESGRYIKRIKNKAYMVIYDKRIGQSGDDAFIIAEIDLTTYNQTNIWNGRKSGYNQNVIGCRIEGDNIILKINVYPGGGSVYSQERTLNTSTGVLSDYQPVSGVPDFEGENVNGKHYRGNNNTGNVEERNVADGYTGTVLRSLPTGFSQYVAPGSGEYFGWFSKEMVLINGDVRKFAYCSWRDKQIWIYTLPA